MLLLLLHIPSWFPNSPNCLMPACCYIWAAHCWSASKTHEAGLKQSQASCHDFVTSCSSLDSAWPGFSPNHFTGTVLVQGLVVKASPKSVCLSFSLSSSLPPPALSFQKHLIVWSSPMTCLALLGSSPSLLLSGLLCTHRIVPSLACLFRS